MVKYTIEAITALLGHVCPIQGQPTFKSLWQLSQELSVSLGKLTHPKHPDKGFTGYIMPAAAFALFSRKTRANPVDVGEYFTIPTVAITKTEIKTEENKWKANKDLRENFDNVRLAL